MSRDPLSERARELIKRIRATSRAKAAEVSTTPTLRAQVRGAESEESK